MQQELKNTAYIVLETEDSTISINDSEDINEIINTLINARTKKAKILHGKKAYYGCIYMMKRKL